MSSAATELALLLGGHPREEERPVNHGLPESFTEWLRSAPGDEVRVGGATIVASAQALEKWNADEEPPEGLTVFGFSEDGGGYLAFSPDARVFVIDHESNRRTPLGTLEEFFEGYLSLVRAHDGRT